MSTTVIALLAGVGALVLALSLALWLRDRSRSADRLAQAVDEMRHRMDDLAHDLSDALERAEREGRRNRLLGELGASIDMDEVLSRILDEALEVPGFAAGMITLQQPGKTPLVETRGMSADEIAAAPRSGPGGAAGTITVSYRFGPEDGDNGEVIRGGVFVPLVGRDGETMGTLALFWREDGFEPPREAVQTLEQLARSSIAAIENARRYDEARELAETDALTGLHNQRYFHDALRREVLRAQRYDRGLSLLVLDLDDFKRVNDTIGHLAGDAVLAHAAELLRETIRSVDIACRIGGDEFAVILPESGGREAEQLYRRLRQLVGATSFGHGTEHMRVSGGIAELRPADNAANVFHRADAALLRAKELGKDRAEREASAPELNPGF